jgi:hypothetical protein
MFYPKKEFKMQAQEIIRKYLIQLELYLARLSKSEAQEVLREIESHIYDALEHQQAAGEEVDANAILRGFGEPRDLAALYVAHITTGSPLPPGFRAMKMMKRGINRGLYLTMATFGYAVSLFLLLIVTFSLVPGGLGLRNESNGQSGYIGFYMAPLPQSQEWLGYTSILIVFILALLTIKLTQRVLKVLKNQM